MILAVRTDKPEAELYLLTNSKVLAEQKWQAHRELADTLLIKIGELLKMDNAVYKDLTGIIIFTGEGSFTGLRIGTTVANSLAYSLQIPITSSKEPNWIMEGNKKLRKAKLGDLVVPEYDSEPNITTPKAKKLQLEDKSK